MIYDKLDNIEMYKGLSEDIYEGLVFLKNKAIDAENGTYQLNPRVKAVVSEYDTKTQNLHGFEAHKRFVDIQCTVKGLERIDCLPLDCLDTTEPYNEEKDVAFFSSKCQPHKLVVGNGFFVILFPIDGHMPKLCLDEPAAVKKVVIKVEL